MPSTSEQDNGAKLDQIISYLRNPPTDKIDELAVKMDRLIDEVGRLTHRVDKVSEEVDGNGKPGLKTDVHDLQHTMSVMGRVLWIVTGVLVTSLTYALIDLLRTGQIKP